MTTYERQMGAVTINPDARSGTLSVLMRDKRDGATTVGAMGTFYCDPP